MTESEPRLQDVPEEYDGCARECRKAGAHTHVWGRCAEAPEPTATGKESFPLRDRIDAALQAADAWAQLQSPDDRARFTDAVMAEIEGLPNRGYCEHCGRGDCTPTAAQWDEQHQHAKQAERELKQTRAAVRMLAERWLGPDFQRAYGDGLLAVLDNPEGYLRMRAALDRPDEAALPKLCPIGYRPHRPHTWTDGGPLRACPGVTDQPEDHRG